MSDDGFGPWYVGCWVVVLCPQHHAAGGTQILVGTVSPSLNNTGVYTYAAGHSLFFFCNSKPLFGHWAMNLTSLVNLRLTNFNEWFWAPPLVFGLQVGGYGGGLLSRYGGKFPQ